MIGPGAKTYTWREDVANKWIHSGFGLGSEFQDHGRSMRVVEVSQPYWSCDHNAVMIDYNCLQIGETATGKRKRLRTDPFRLAYHAPSEQAASPQCCAVVPQDVAQQKAAANGTRMKTYALPYDLAMKSIGRGFGLNSEFQDGGSIMQVVEISKPHWSPDHDDLVIDFQCQQVSETGGTKSRKRAVRAD